VVLSEQFAHVLLFTCPHCGRPLASACASNNRNLEVADAHWFQPHCFCGWVGDVAGMVAVKHWVEPWEGKGSLENGNGSCDGHPLQAAEVRVRLDE
jgi:hypothetical protein